MTPQELLDQQAARDVVKASNRLEREAARATNWRFMQQDDEPFGTLPARITTEVAPVPFEGEDIGGSAA